MNSLKPSNRYHALQTILNKWHVHPSPETVSISDAEGRILEENIYSKNTLPVKRCAGMDGIGVKYADFKDGLPDTSKWELGVDYCMADTGDDFDDLFDTIIRIEDVAFSENGEIQIETTDPIKKGQLIKDAGSVMKKDELLLSSGTIINALQMNMLVSGGCESLTVAKRPKIVYIPTGNELIPRGTVPQRGENIESNGIMVEAFIGKWGGNTIRYDICKDIKSDLKTTLNDAVSEGDIVLLNGGSSKGSEDFSAELIRGRSSWFQHGFDCIPGFTASMGLIDNTPVVNIPGPPMANFSMLHWCVRPLVYGAMGIAVPAAKITTAVLKDDLRKSSDIDFYQGLKLSVENGKVMATPLPSRGPVAGKMARCNGMAVVEAGSTYRAGDMIDAEWLD